MFLASVGPGEEMPHSKPQRLPTTAQAVQGSLPNCSGWCRQNRLIDHVHRVLGFLLLLHRLFWCCCSLIALG